MSSALRSREETTSVFVQRRQLARINLSGGDERRSGQSLHLFAMSSVAPKSHSDTPKRRRPFSPNGACVARRMGADQAGDFGPIQEQQQWTDLQRASSARGSILQGKSDSRCLWLDKRTARKTGHNREADGQTTDKAQDVAKYIAPAT